MKEIYIEEFKDEHAPYVSKIIRRNLFEVLCDRYPIDTMDRMAEHYNEQSILEIAKERKIFVATENGAVIGTGSLQKSKDGNDGLYWIFSVYIKPEYQGKGVGKKLMGVLEDYAKNCGARKIKLVCTYGAIGFYKAIGYKKIDGASVEGLGDMMEKVLA